MLEQGKSKIDPAESIRSVLEFIIDKKTIFRYEKDKQNKWKKVFGKFADNWHLLSDEQKETMLNFLSNDGYAQNILVDGLKEMQQNPSLALEIGNRLSSSGFLYPDLASLKKPLLRNEPEEAERKKIAEKLKKITLGKKE